MVLTIQLFTHIRNAINALDVGYTEEQSLLEVKIIDYSIDSHHDVPQSYEQPWDELNVISCNWGMTMTGMTAMWSVAKFRTKAEMLVKAVHGLHPCEAYRSITMFLKELT